MNLNSIRIFLIFVMAVAVATSMTSAEVNVWQTIYIQNDTSTVTQHTVVQVDETTPTITLHKYVPVNLRYQTKGDLPYSVNYGTIDNCNLSVVQQVNTYSSDQTLLTNYTLNYDTRYFTGSATNGIINLQLSSRDVVIADFICHYTDARDLFFDSIVLGDVQVEVPAFKCKGCTADNGESFASFTQAEQNQTDQNQNQIFDKAYKIASYDIQIWQIGRYLLKIALLFAGLSLVFALVYGFYRFIEGLKR